MELLQYVFIFSTESAFDGLIMELSSWNTCAIKAYPLLSDPDNLDTPENWVEQVLNVIWTENY